jgi:hypothetical protein
MNTRRTAALLVATAVFDYPDVLEQPADEVLASFRASQFAVVVLAVVLVVRQRRRAGEPAVAGASVR